MQFQGSNNRGCLKMPVLMHMLEPCKSVMLAQNTKTTQQQSDVMRTSSTCKRKKEKTAEEMQNTSKQSDENDGNRKHEKCSI